MSEIDVNINLLFIVLGRCRFGGVVGYVFALLGNNKAYGVVKAVDELREILSVKEYLVLLECYRCCFSLALDNFFAFGYREIHLIPTVLLNIDVVDSFACFDGL